VVQKPEEGKIEEIYSMPADKAFLAKHADLMETLTAEALAFGYFNRVFYEKPTAEFLDTQKSEALFDHWPLEAQDDFTTTGVKIMRDFMSKWEREMLDELIRDYRRLFIGPGHIPAPPWESVYLSIEGLVYEEQTMAVRKFYARYGLQSPKRYKEPDDHFGLEMAFLAHLCTLGLASIQAGDSDGLAGHLEAMSDFLKEHLLLWVLAFLNRVIEHAQTAYYRGAAYLALGSIYHIAELLDLEIDQAPDDP
jgi:TorA maturation chaperone TorD